MATTIHSAVQLPHSATLALGPSLLGGSCGCLGPALIPVPRSVLPDSGAHLQGHAQAETGLLEEEGLRLKAEAWLLGPGNYSWKSLAHSGLFSTLICSVRGEEF